jgi:CheY-like chemotaxis protein
MATILFVDDDLTTLQLMIQLAQFINHSAITCSSAAEGLEMAASRQPDMIFVDKHMRDMDGIKFVKFLRSDTKSRHIPCILLSADKTREDITAARAAGANGFFLKPVQLDEITRVIKHFTEKK